jgi:hypothetical protein
MPRFPLQRLSGVFAPRSPFRAAVVATAEGTSPERGRASEPAAPRETRTSRGDGVVKAAGTKSAWARLLRRVERVGIMELWRPQPRSKPDPTAGQRLPRARPVRACRPIAGRAVTARAAGSGCL